MIFHNKTFKRIVRAGLFSSFLFLSLTVSGDADASIPRNHQALKEALKELVASSDEADELQRLIEISENISNSENNQAAQTVLNMEKAKADAFNINDLNRRQRLIDTSMAGLSVTGNPYEEIENLYRALVTLGSSSQGPMYYEYITRLDDLVRNLPEKDHAIKNLFYTTAALFYTRKRDYKKAIMYDQDLLDQLDSLKEFYQKNNITDHNLDYFYYVSYRRMLRNFMGLTPEQVEEYYNKCLELAQTNEKVAESFGTGGLTKSYYFIATGNFKDAIPELQKALASDEISKFRRRELQGLLAWSYRETGDYKSELEMLRQFTNSLLEERQQRMKDTEKEIKLRNNVTQLMAEKLKEQEKDREENRRMRKTSLTLVYVLAVILIFLCQAYLRLRHKVKDLESRNTKLRTNIEHIFDDGMPSGSRDLRHQKNRLKG